MIAQTGITYIQRIVPLVIAVVVVVFVVELIRRRKLREEYAMLWISASGVLLVFAAVPQLVMWAAGLLGVYYITLMLLLSFCFLSLVIVHLSVAVSRASDDLRKLAQRTALLEEELRRRNNQPDRDAARESRDAPDDRPVQSPGGSA
ncbi:MAG: DUF2304 domain-containing protein [Phycisphaerae bacterium]|nr:DUF2304 domain-containing protein [Phycisphaerae bacterium]